MKLLLDGGFDQKIARVAGICQKCARGMVTLGIDRDINELFSPLVFIASKVLFAGHLSLVFFYCYSI